MSDKKSYVFIGTGGRAIASFIKPMLKEFPDAIDIVGVFDINPLRAKAAVEISAINTTVFTDFEEMIKQAQPDRAVICTTDCTHAEYIVKCLDSGIDIFSEKPVCTTLEQVAVIRQASQRNTADAFVTHNMRFEANMEEIKRQLDKNTIGKVLHIQFTEVLDRYHGADYFRRWHREIEKSGGLMLHKSSHHFDVINWFANSLPQTVSAQGRLAFYGKNGSTRGSRCSECDHAKKCQFYADVFKASENKLLYKDAEPDDGYIRDGCVFDEAIDIADTVNANISFENGVEASYSLIAYGSYEGIDISIEGTEGRLEFKCVHSTFGAVGHPDAGATLLMTALVKMILKS